MYRRVTVLSIVLTTGVALCSACSSAFPGPDKQMAGTLQGASVGAGAGAVTGFQVGAPTGAGALVGAGFGAIAGGIHGAVQDSLEEENLKLQSQLHYERERSRAQRTLLEQFERRMELHPSREIYPADIFFSGDDFTVSDEARPLAIELARLNENRQPWSRLVIACYVNSSDEDNSYAKRLAERRAESLGNWFVKTGINPRRIEARAVLIDGPIVLDYQDDPLRFNQAVEIILLDK